MADTLPEMIEYYRLIAARMYISWLERQGVLHLLDQPITIPNLYYQQNWNERNIEAFDSVLSYLSVMGFFISAGGTYEKKQNFALLTEQLDAKLDNINYEHYAIYSFINYCLSLFEEQIEGGTGSWSKDRYILLENLFSSEVFTILNKQIMDAILNNPEIHKVVFLGLYHELALEGVEKNNYSPDNVRFVVFNGKLSRIARSYAELSEDRSLFSKSIVRSHGMAFKADAIVISNGIGLHLSVKKLVELSNQYALDKCHIWVIDSFQAKSHLGYEPMLTFINDDFVELPDHDSIKKYLKTKMYVRDDSVDKIPLVYNASRLTRI